MNSLQKIVTMGICLAMKISGLCCSIPSSGVLEMAGKKVSSCDTELLKCAALRVIDQSKR